MIKISKTDVEFWELDKPNTKLTQTIFDWNNSSPERYQDITTNFESRFKYMVEHCDGNINFYGCKKL